MQMPSFSSLDECLKCLEVPAVAKQRRKGWEGGGQRKRISRASPETALSVPDPSRRRLSRLSEIVGRGPFMAFRASLSKKYALPLSSDAGGGSLGVRRTRL